ncbi:MAG: lysophospholipid acyltransferase family protein [Pseudomonadota bacterium]|nr:lysophospholipid acyltransferase family protein [Pseudomonadota bacterium]
MMYLRSLIFNILFYGVTAVLAILALPTMLLPAAAIQAVARFWGLLTLLLLRIVGATHRVSGEIHHGRQVIYAAKHQSAWETIVLSLLLRTPVVVLKRELLKLPLLGWYFGRAGCIAVDRSAGMRALRQLRDDALAARDAGRSLLIFPQGTRVAPGARHKYEVGVFALYEATGLPVVPIALNSGHVWGRNSWTKRAGRIEVEFLPAIAPGMARRDFMASLETAIETRMAVLDAPYLDETAMTADGD